MLHLVLNLALLLRQSDATDDQIVITSNNNDNPLAHLTHYNDWSMVLSIDSSLFRTKSNSESSLSVATSIDGLESDILYIFAFGEKYILIQNNTKELKIYPPCASKDLSIGNPIKLLSKTDSNIDTLRVILRGMDHNWDIVTTDKHHDLIFEFVNNEIDDTFIVSFGSGMQCKYNSAVNTNNHVNMVMISDWSHRNAQIIPTFIINGYRSKEYSNGRRLIARMENVAKDDSNDNKKDNTKGNTVSISKWKDVMIHTVVSIIGGITLVLIITFLMVKCCGVKEQALLTEENIKRLSYSSYEDVNSPLLDHVQTKD